MSSTADPFPASLLQVIQRFKRQPDQKRRYELLIWFAKRLQEFPANDKVPENKVPGCVSQVYVTATLEDGVKLSFRAILILSWLKGW